MGAWIEILIASPHTIRFPVAPLVGAWIEITISPASNIRLMSLPLWERGSSRFENEKFYIRLQINGVEDTAYLLCIIWSW